MTAILQFWRRRRRRIREPDAFYKAHLDMLSKAVEPTTSDPVFVDQHIWRPEGFQSEDSSLPDQSSYSARRREELARRLDDVISRVRERTGHPGTDAVLEAFVRRLDEARHDPSANPAVLERFIHVLGDAAAIRPFDAAGGRWPAWAPNPLFDQPIGTEAAEEVAPVAEQTIEHTLARMFMRLGPPPEPTELDYESAGSGGGGAQQ
ncbi:hypothetical protein ACH4YN_33285 [Streptomyces griseofuscus]|uniref:hypothetical protein n=1 Tax=Streptomyces griseofuscus TaxID=146922 RepID=UPI0037B01E61